MKIIISYPPLKNDKGCPTLGQNRQFQYFKEPTYIYPVVPASAATMLKNAGHEVIWNDCLAEGMGEDAFFDLVRRERPDVIAFETKTPVIKQHWALIDKLKLPAARQQSLVTVLFGDHVTALPEESFDRSGVDYVLTGGDYDFLLLNLCNFLQAHNVRLPSSILRPPSDLEPGIFYRENSRVRSTGPFRLDHDLNTYFIDRELTKWHLYACKNGNFKRTPGTYLMSARDCWWGKCRFCSWPTLYPTYRMRKPDNVLDEMQELVEKYRVREIMDDSGCFPAGDWLREFCRGAVRRGLHASAYLDCNMRFGALSGDDFRLMKKANFRLLLFGLESASQETLDRVRKNVKVERIIEDCKSATAAGLYPHITIMFGYPWETYEEASRTLRLGQWLLKKGYAYTMQATMVIPYPGTGLFDECRQNGWLLTDDWSDYDMKQPVMRSPIPAERLLGLVQGMYRVSFSPEFVVRKLASVRDLDDVRYYVRAFRKVFGHLFDFGKRTTGCDKAP